MHITALFLLGAEKWPEMKKNRLELGLELWRYFSWGLINGQNYGKKNSRLELGLDLCS